MGIIVNICKNVQPKSYVGLVGPYIVSFHVRYANSRGDEGGVSLLESTGGVLTGVRELFMASPQSYTY